MFLPTTMQECQQLGWSQPDIILVTGDSYIDSPFIGIAVIGKVLTNAGFKVAIIAQPEAEDISRLGEPTLFWGVTGGCMDSMVTNYTALKKPRRSDDFTPGGENTKRPDRACLAYSNLIRRYFKNTVPIVLGGVEASLRRVTHYDFWSNKLRRSILFDAKADYLLYGMGEHSSVRLAEALRDHTGVETVQGLCYMSKEPREEYLALPDHDLTTKDHAAFIEMFSLFYGNNDPQTAKGLCQKVDARYLIQNPPAEYLTAKELDHIHELGFELAQHPFYQAMGSVKALETIKFSIPTHRGCYGECNFCAIAVHQGRTVRSRSESSVVAEAEKLTRLDDFKGYISDVGGPTANMYGYECHKKLASGPCATKRCLYPKVCRQLKPSHRPQLELLKKVRKISGVKKVFVASGIRYDLILDDSATGLDYLKEVVAHHVSGQMKVAPEHTEERILSLMGKPGRESLLKFRELFYKMNEKAGKKQFLTYYLIAAHPGCSEDEMKSLKEFSSKELRVNPEQVQVFTPTPSTWSSVMYYTGIDPFSGKKIFVEKDPSRKQKQKEVVTQKFRSSHARAEGPRNSRKSSGNRSGKLSTTDSKRSDVSSNKSKSNRAGKFSATTPHQKESGKKTKNWHKKRT